MIKSPPLFSSGQLTLEVKDSNCFAHDSNLWCNSAFVTDACAHFIGICPEKCTLEGFTLPLSMAGCKQDLEAGGFILAFQHLVVRLNA